MGSPEKVKSPASKRTQQMPSVQKELGKPTADNWFPKENDRKVNYGGRDLVYPSQMEACFLPLLKGQYEIPHLPDEPKVTTILDIGAACGGFAAWAQQRWPTSKVICYEPDPDMARYCRHNAPMADVREMAVSYSSSEVDLHLGPEGHRGFNSIMPSAVGYMWHERSIRVPAVLSSQLPECDVLKVDAEGIEARVFGHYLHLEKVWCVAYEWHSEKLRQVCENILQKVGLTMVWGHTQDPDMGEQVWCRTKARMKRRGNWHYVMPGDMK